MDNIASTISFISIVGIFGLYLASACMAVYMSRKNKKKC